MCQTSQRSENCLEVTVHREPAVEGLYRVRAELITPATHHTQGAGQFFCLINDSTALILLHQVRGSLQSADDRGYAGPQKSGELSGGEAKSADVLLIPAFTHLRLIERQPNIGGVDQRAVLI